MILIASDKSGELISYLWEMIIGLSESDYVLMSRCSSLWISDLKISRACCKTLILAIIPLYIWTMRSRPCYCYCKNWTFSCKSFSMSLKSKWEALPLSSVYIFICCKNESTLVGSFIPTLYYEHTLSNSLNEGKQSIYYSIRSSASSPRLTWSKYLRWWGCSPLLRSTKCKQLILPNSFMMSQSLSFGIMIS